MLRVWLLALFCLPCNIYAREYHVSVKGNDKNVGTANKPFRTINKAASLAMPGDVITIHAGVYRECVVPPRGGISDGKRIVYRASPGEIVEIKGSEIVTGWTNVYDDLWKVTLPYSFFGNYNPFTDRVYGDWFGGWIHTGEVYLDGKPLSETDSLFKIMNGVPAMNRANNPVNVWDEHYTWYAKSDSGKIIIYARFGKADPNKNVVEVNVRKACFYPEKNFINYLTVQGFRMSQAASQWAAPTAEQPGLIGTNWSKGWIIEDNIISNSKCSGITLGKDRTTGDNMWNKDRSIDGSTHYNEAVHRVIANGWNKDTIGSHIVRNNIIYNCGQAGICGSFGGAFSEIYGNEIFDVYTYRVYGGAEMGGIKLHAAIDVIIRDNYLHNTNIGIWLDWMAQGTRVCGNLFYDNDNTDLFVEVNHGPYVIDNNIFLSTNAIQDWSEGGAFVHNLIGGTIATWPQWRKTPVFTPHTTKWLGIYNIKGGDDRYFNNVFAGNKATAKWADAFFQPDTVKQLNGLSVYNHSPSMSAAGNVYVNGAIPGKFETNVSNQLSQHPVIINDRNKVYLQWSVGTTTADMITTTTLGKTQVSNAAFENPDGTTLIINRDYFSSTRKKEKVTIGPFEAIGSTRLQVWPKN